MLFLSVILGLAVAIVDANTLPSPLKPCSQKSPEFHKCIGEEAMKGFKVIGSKGLPQYGVKPITPLDLESFVIGGDSSSIGLAQSYKNAAVSGLENAVVSETKGTDKNCPLPKNFKLFIPKLEFLSDYELNGKILLLPLTGKGKCNITLINVRTKLTIGCERINLDGKNHLKLNEFKLKIKPENVMMQFDNLFNGDKALSIITNMFLNENWKDIFSEMNPYYEDIISDKLKDVANKFVLSIPETNLFS